MKDVERLFEHVKQELSRLRGRYRLKTSQKSWLIQCPFHPDSDPSLSVNVGNRDAPPGVFLCFGCHAHGSWNLLAQRLGLEPFSEEDVRNLRLATKLANGVAEQWTYRPPRRLEDIPENFRYGKLKASVLKRYGARLWVDPVLEEKRVLFLVSVWGEVLGHVSLPLSKVNTKASKARYSPGNWVRRALWPFDHLPNTTDVLVLVEGVRDALRLLQVGLPTLAVLGGVTVWSPYKRELVLAKNPKRLILVTDGDRSGYRLAKRLLAEFRHLVPTVWFKLPIVEHPAPLDPYNMPAEYLRKLKKLVEAKSVKAVRGKLRASGGASQRASEV